MQEDIKTYQQHFQSNIQSIKQSPIQSRSCNDILCLLLFLGITFGFVFMGVFIIKNADYTSQSKVHIPSFLSEENTIPKVISKQINIQAIKKSKWLIIGITCLTIILSIILVLLVTAFPHCIVYTLILLSILSLLGLGIMFIYSAKYWVGSLTFCILLGWILILYCLWDNIEKGVQLLSATGRFMLQKPTVFMAPFFVGFLILIFYSFWLCSFYGIYLIPKNTFSNQYFQVMLSTVWVIIAVFYTYFLYYVMVFLIATCASLWYYGIYDQNYIFTAIKWITFSHLGSLTFASLMITILTIFRYSTSKVTQNSSSVNPCYKCLHCLVQFFIQEVQSLISVLNHNAVIVMSVTGQNYLYSAKSSMALVYKNYQLFIIADAIGVLVSIFGTIVIVGIPSLIGYFIMINNVDDLKKDDIMTVMSVIMVLSISISILFVNILSQSLSSMFILECLNSKFLQIGLKLVNSILPELNALLSEMNILKGNNNGGMMIPLTDRKNNNEYGSNMNMNPYGNMNEQPFLNSPSYQNNPYDLKPFNY